MNVYHHVDRRREYFRRFRRLLAPGGRLAIVDWRKQADLPLGPPPEHRISAARVVEELRGAGYAHVGSLGFLPYQHGQVFRVVSGAPE